MKYPLLLGQMRQYWVFGLMFAFPFGTMVPRAQKETSGGQSLRGTRIPKYENPEQTIEPSVLTISNCYDISIAIMIGMMHHGESTCSPVYAFDLQAPRSNRTSLPGFYKGKHAIFWHCCATDLLEFVNSCF